MWKEGHNPFLFADLEEQVGFSLRSTSLHLDWALLAILEGSEWVLMQKQKLRAFPSVPQQISQWRHTPLERNEWFPWVNEWASLSAKCLTAVS